MVKGIKVMKQLSSKLEGQLNQVIAESQRSPALRFRDLVQDMIDCRAQQSLANWQRAAELYVERVKGLAPCFLLSVLDAVIDHINPVMHVIACDRWDPEDDTCKLGLNSDKCDECPEYTARKQRWIDLCKEKPCRFQCEDSPCCDQGGKPDA